MNMFLDRIVSTKRVEIICDRQNRPLNELKEIIRDIPPPRCLAEALRDQSCGIIAEIKRCSPSKGILRDVFDHVELASVYQNCGAAAISVLTDREFFGGEKTYLSDIKKICRLPLLRKDFIVDAYQVYETRVLNGDALLLIAGILKKDELHELIGLTEGLGMYPLVEVHSREELDKALSAGAVMIGINNRDLNTFSTDLSVSLTLAPQVSPEILLISESGIHTRQDIIMLQNAGIHAFLIGETLMRAGNVGNKLQELLGMDA